MAPDETATDDRIATGEPPAFGEGLIGVLLGGDGLRAIAALMIFFGHVFVNADPGQAFENYGWAKDVVGRLDLGLGLFFALSGYLITRPFLRSFILDTKRPDVRRFARNRVLRIVPAFYVMAAIVLLRFGLDGAISPTPDNPSGTAPASAWWQVLSVFTFTQSYTGGSATLPLGQAWSLDAEAAYYIAIPLAAAVAFRVGTRIRTAPARARAALVVIAGLGLVSIYLRHGDGRSFSALTSPPLILYAFVPGIFLAALEPLAAPYLRRDPRRATRLGWALFATAALAWILYSRWDYAAQTTALHHALGRRALMAIVFSGAVLAAVMAWQLGTERSPRWLATRTIRWLGERSYAIYLFHVWVLFEVSALVGTGTSTTTLAIAMVALGLPLTLAVSELSWRFVEQPFLQRRVRWAGGDPTPGPGTRPPGEAHASVQPGVDPTDGRDDDTAAEAAQPERALP
jgi:peptidoglycan/LPS O-acetylase OafA/YrhL